MFPQESALKRRVRRGIALLATCTLMCILAACGGSSSNPAAPSGGGSGAGSGSSSGSGGTPAAGGTFAISVDGAPFNALSITAVCSTPGPAIVSIVGVSGSGASTTSLSMTALAQAGVHTIAPSQFTQGVMTVIAGSTGSGFMAFQTLGRGTITITAISATSVSGSVDLVLVPTSGATTNRAITGTFNVPVTGGATSCAAAPSGTIPGGTGGGGGTGNATTGTLTALIDGGSFNGALGLTATHTNNQLSISGANNQYTLQLILNATGPGTYPISSSTATTVALALNGTAQAWFAGPTIGSGTITISSLTSSTVTGTFTVTLGPSVGGSTTGNRVITNGVFNVPLSASAAVPPSLPPPAPGSGASSRTISATVDGVSWSGTGAAQATRTAQGFVTIAGADLQGRALSIAIFASATGTYSLNNPNSHNGLWASGTQIWFTSRPGGGGSVTITSIDTSRVTGTFTMTLAPAANNTDQRTLQAVSGAFDLVF